MIAFRHFALRRGSRLLLSDIDLTIQSGWRLGVIGRNGCGKSSLFAVLQGRLEADAGSWLLPAGVLSTEWITWSCSKYTMKVL